MEFALIPLVVLGAYLWWSSRRKSRQPVPRKTWPTNGPRDGAGSRLAAPSRPRAKDDTAAPRADNSVWDAQPSWTSPTPDDRPHNHSHIHAFGGGGGGSFDGGGASANWSQVDTDSRGSSNDSSASDSGSTSSSSD